MITMRGKYNTANVMIDEIDATTKDQIQGFLNHPAFGNTYIAIMPDCHAGKGAVVGFTMKLNNYIIPNIVGVDIGCGMLAANFGNVSVDAEALDAFVKANVPAGFNLHNNPVCEPSDEVKSLAARIGADVDKVARAVGTLGGGNHFIEAGRDSCGNVWVTIHSGSRNLGLRVANYHQGIAKDELAKYFIRDTCKDLEFLLVNSDAGADYLEDVSIAQNYASLNRQQMMRAISGFIGKPVSKIESVHNFIGEDGIIRKGATSARYGERVLIPFNMRDGIAICTGLGSSKYNCSAPHGAGRIMSRTQAKKTIDPSHFADDMRAAGVYTTTANASTIDEAPEVYKPMDSILENINETVTVDDMIRPFYSFKAGGD